MNRNGYIDDFADIEKVIHNVDPQIANQIFAPQPILQPIRRMNPHVIITEQPDSESLRWRYDSEGRTAGSLPGANSVVGNLTFPTIKVVGYQGKARVVVSCVTENYKHQAHPHKLVGRDCKDGYCLMDINTDSMSVSFSNLGIQCVKRRDVRESLNLRKRLKLDPFNASFDHINNTASIDLSVIRLCFQVFINNPITRQFDIPLRPVVSNCIKDKKPSGLVICKLSDCSSSAVGGKTIILLCEKVNRSDIAVRFFEEIKGHTVWEEFGGFLPTDVHKQVAITLKTPCYFNGRLRDPVMVQVQLYRPSDREFGPSIPFQYIPAQSNYPEQFQLNRKIPRASQIRQVPVIPYLDEACCSSALSNLSLSNGALATDINNPTSSLLEMKCVENSMSVASIPGTFAQPSPNINAFYDNDEIMQSNRLKDMPLL